MTKAIKSDRTLILYVDHTNFLQQLRKDVIIRDINVPPVISHSKIPPAAACAQAEASSSSTVVASEKGKSPVSENVELHGSDSDSDLSQDQKEDGQIHRMEWQLLRKTCCSK